MAQHQTIEIVLKIKKTKMKKINFLNTSMAIGILFSLGACNKNAEKNISQPDQPKGTLEEMISEKGANPDEVSITENSGGISGSAREGSNSGHYLYTESNDIDNNKI